MSDNPINSPDQAAPASRASARSAARLSAPIGSIAWSPLASNTGVRSRRRVATHTVVAPQRFDVHRLPDLAAWLDQADELGAARLTVDLSDVRFIDQAAIDALDLLGRNPSVAVEFVNPSTAYSLTACLVASGSSTPSAASNPLVVRTDERSTCDGSSSRKNQCDPPVVIEVGGDLTVLTALEFRNNSSKLVGSTGGNNANRPVVIDLQNVDHLDAAGLAAVTATTFEIRRSGRNVTVREPRRPEPARFARLTGVLPLLAKPDN